MERKTKIEDSSKLTMHVIYRSVAIRDQILQLPFAQGINMAHNRMQEIVGKLKKYLIKTRSTSINRNTIAL